MNFLLKIKSLSVHTFLMHDILLGHLSFWVSSAGGESVPGRRARACYESHAAGGMVLLLPWRPCPV